MNASLAQASNRLAIPFLLFAGLLSLPETATANQDLKLQNDVTYSARNYKHVNKAVTASQWALEPNLENRNTPSRKPQLVSYKKPVLDALKPVDLQILPQPVSDQRERNYKIPN